ncbi:dynactin p62 family-domain-containing protein [Microdochium trichocladiopsis]|uniref:Dynactin subunit 4 n=1 Tax=Microdochium trichocladiopsis TaxID=1682393 RepID=A0A9P9BY52_9PEZI|nr:dynactin p62 family-domain-containing protein [Microdochium trichocladiopsis]KAH7037708.1 dynactin p62 family-domain-containing protein [Microdochium trichocladiopsis]
MASFTPYTYIQCPCYDANGNGHTGEDQAENATDGGHIDDDADENTFDPRSPRSGYSLFPLEHLLYCDVCQQIRCPRCVAEELVNIYCPNCLFEVATSSLKTEGNRCTRSCFQCPICIGPLSVQALETAPDPGLLQAENPAAQPTSGPWILTCSYCHWTSTEIGVQFDKPQGISAQLAKLRNGDDVNRQLYGSPVGDMSPLKSDAVPDATKSRFATLKSFYQSQLAESTSGGAVAGLGEYGYSSPAALSRIMNIYSGNLGGLKPKGRAPVMREADTPAEGLRLSDLDETAAQAKLRSGGYDGSVTIEQAKAQVEEGARFADELWPIPYLLRSKRSKRCPVCRHIISKPESKVGNTRWRIRLVANNYIPSISIRPLSPPAPAASLLKPLNPVQFLLTFKNPIFEDVKVTLATPAVTPGRFASRVTILCPQFSLDANTDTDMYLEDVLKDGGSKERQRRQPGEDGMQQAEAGKVWERGRNWVSIVVEVVPASLRNEPPPALLHKDGDPEPDLSPLKENEDILEIPLFVHLEWEGEVSQDQVGTAIGKEKDAKEKKELAYWSVLGLGRIEQA